MIIEQKDNDYEFFDLVDAEKEDGTIVQVKRKTDVNNRDSLVNKKTELETELNQINQKIDLIDNL
jgi:hypothetical protein